jgi:energy-coupling factor transporter ATP-binding protein EcfA2
MTAAVSLSFSEAEDVCPFPGLRPFSERDARFYFGRENQRDECLQRLQEHRFLAVIGASGAGKSSLVRAGLLPALSQGLLKGADENWEHVVFRPGPDPMAALARALGKLDAGVMNAADVEQELRSSSRGLARAVARLNGAAPARQVLVVVDQFEELFRLGKERYAPEQWRAERAAFIKTVLGARTSSEASVYVVITMRTDFLDQCSHFLGLTDALNSGQFLVPELTREQLEHAITRPIERARGEISRAVVRRVLSEATQVPDSLPVVQHALMRTWQRARDEGSATITLDHYQAVGGLVGALDDHGNELLKRLDPKGSDDGMQRAVKLLFQRITLTNADDKVTRSPTSFGTLVRLAQASGVPRAESVLRAVVDVFRANDCRFLMPPEDEAVDVDTEIDISHEAVFRNWRLLSGAGDNPGWIAREHRDGRAYCRLAEAARVKRRGEGQLLTEELLALTEAWWASRRPTAEWASRYHVLDATAQALIERAKGSAAGGAFQRDVLALEGWHREQFALSKGFLEESVAARDAEVAARRALERAAESARREALDAQRLAEKAEADARVQAELNATRARFKNIVIGLAVVCAAVLGVLLLQLRSAHGTAEDARLEVERAQLETRAAIAARETALSDEQVAKLSQREAERQLASTRDAITNKQRELNAANDSLSAAEERLRVAEERLSRIRSENDELTLANDRLTAEKTRLGADMKRLENDRNRLYADIEQGNAVLKQMRVSAEEQQRRIDELEKRALQGEVCKLLSGRRNSKSEGATHP